MILAVEYSDENQKIINVSDNDFSTSGDDGNSEMCCVHGNCSCNSLDQALANLTSNVIVNIKTDMTLSSLVNPYDLVNVSIIGHSNPIVNCGSAGGIQLTICHNCIIQGIVWDGCGSKSTDNNTEPMLKLNNSSNVKLQNCTFQNLMGQAIVLSEMSGEMYIRDCNFVKNSYYRDHGAIVYFVVSQLSQLLLTISNCNFTHNKGAKSLVYIENKNSDFNINFYDSNFCHNQGTSIYAVNQRLYFTGNVLFQHNTAENGTGIYITEHSSVIFGKNSNTKNFADFTGEAVFSRNHSNIAFDQDCIITFKYNRATNGIIYSEVNSNVTFKENCHITFSSNSVTQYGTIYSNNHSHISFEGNSNTIFSNNIAYFQGGAICSLDHGNISFEGNSTTIFSNNSAHFLGGAICSSDHGHISFGGTSTTMPSNNSDHGHICFEGAFTTLFIDNSAGNRGGAIYSYNHGNITFEGNSATIFCNNSADYAGGAISLPINGHISFKEISTTIFNNNTANHGGAIANRRSNIYFQGSSTTVFSSNTGVYGGGAIIHFLGSLSFKGISNTSFSSNTAGSGGAIQFRSSNISFEDNSTTLFRDNNALQGGAMFSEHNGSVSFNEYSTAMLNDNKATNGGVLSCIQCTVVLKGNSTVLLAFNEAVKDGGVMHFISSSKFSFSEFTNVTFKKNSAINGGALFASDNSIISFEGHALVTFTGNTAGRGGGVLSCIQCTVLLKGNSTVSSAFNEAIKDGGVMSFTSSSNILFSEFTNATFRKNSAINGGSLFASDNSIICFDGHALVTFTGNTAGRSGGVLFCIQCTVLLKGNSTVSTAFNEASEDGGVLQFTSSSNILFSEFTNATFRKNSAINGGALFARDNSNIRFEGHALVTFTGNTAGRSGGAAYFNLHCIVTWTQNASIIFENNNAVSGGAVCLNKYTSAILNSNSVILFTNNTVISEGGAISILTNSSIIANDSTMVTFTINNALYGGAMFFDRTNTTLTFNNNNTGINFARNNARISGNNIYFDLFRSGQNCLNNRAFGVADETKRHIVTPPNKLQLSHPAICISDNNKTEECDHYYLNRLMFGEKIIIPGCLLDCFNKPSYSTQRFTYTFHEFGKHSSYYIINDRTELSLSCQSDALQDIRVIGNESLTKLSNYSIDVTLQNIHNNSNWKQISINLTIQLTPCYPGFWQCNESNNCECYNVSDIVVCSDSTSTIKRGYWFGSVTGKPTIGVCPINYCNFTCCETSNGYYHLSPVRDNQCRSHRTGTACGTCIDGYTLPFGSTECIDTDDCTTGHTILVIFLTVVYWIIMVMLVFAMMYYKVEIGYLYSITYYYSIVDILLSQNLQTSRGLYLTVSIISSFSKIIPQFLGELCFTTGMSGIDQQLIHYMHPLAVIFILIMIIALARRSRRISTIISRGIIHVICLLLLLSYTSIASTSLLLLRSLRFHDINEVYIYLSPDIKYFNGRHLAYGIVALLCTASIVIGLPLLLMLEPLLNHKLNFVKIKPLLDQFQGCYKDKYRCFASYYMICRLLIITLFIINPFNEFVANYFLNAACLVIALIHLMVKPYNNETLNKLDGIILPIIVLITALPILDDGFDSAFVIAIVFVLVFLPLIIFAIMILHLHKDYLKKLSMHLMPKDNPTSSTDDIHDEISMRTFDLIIDDSVRQNVTICDT